MKILVIGGYGFFGRRLVTSLLTHHPHEIVIAGRSLYKARQFCNTVDPHRRHRLTCIQLNTVTDDLSLRFAQLQVDIVVNASGPFQLQRGNKHHYRVAKASIAAGCHYVDLADDREFVVNFSITLNQLATDAGVLCVSGASTVPGLTGAVIDHYLNEFSQLTEIEHGVAPGNRAEKGLATVASILSYTGRPFSLLYKGRSHRVYGWQHLRRYDFGPPLGKRWFGNCQIPDLDLLPAHYPTLETVWFQASLEVPLFHWGLWLLSYLVRLRLIDNLADAAKVLAAIGNRFLHWGSDDGGMFVRMRGRGNDDENKIIDWQLIAEHGAGPNVPTIAAELIINRITEERIAAGAGPCLGLFTLSEFFSVAKRWGIYQRHYCSTDSERLEVTL